MAGIYIHIPFCFSRCGYCDFFKSTKLDRIDSFLKSLKREIVYYSPYFKKTINTLYFGGGTPSLLSIDIYSEILELLKDNYHFSKDVEITIETNPDDLNQKYIDGLLSVGFNRISIGIQSFNDFDLQKMGRRHNATQSLAALNYAYKGGFKNIGIDLIYGLPWSDGSAFKENLSIIKTVSINHLSAYHLSFEEGTPFYNLLKQGIYTEINDVESFNQYEMLCTFASDNGFEHYEVSNFSKPGYRSRHNSSYWNGIPYLGFGPGSHSYYDGKRKWNKSDLSLYDNDNWTLIVEQEFLADSDLFNETVMLGLRTCDGINLNFLQIKFPEFYSSFYKKSNKWIDKGYLYIKNNRIICREKFWLVVDTVIKDLFI